MTKIQRIKNVLIGLAMLLCALVIAIAPEYGYTFIAVVLALSLIAYGLRMLVFYITMARHMVGGRALLYIGVIIFDLGMLTASLSDIPHLHIMVYLLVGHLIAGGLSVARGVEAKRAKAPLWKYSMSYGVGNLLLAVACLAFLWSPDIVVYIYAGGLAYTACVQIASSFRRTAIVYIP